MPQDNLGILVPPGGPANRASLYHRVLQVGREIFKVNVLEKINSGARIAVFLAGQREIIPHKESESEGGGSGGEEEYKTTQIWDHATQSWVDDPLHSIGSYSASVSVEVRAAWQEAAVNHINKTSVHAQGSPEWVKAVNKYKSSLIAIELTAAREARIAANLEKESTTSTSTGQSDGNNSSGTGTGKGTEKKLSNFRKFIIFVGKGILVHACLSLYSAIAFRMYAFWKNGQESSEMESTCTIAEDGSGQQKLMSIGKEDKMLVKFVKASMNAYDPLSRFISFYGSFSAFFKSKNARFVEKEIDEHRQTFFGASVVEFLSNFSRDFANKRDGRCEDEYTLCINPNEYHEEGNLNESCSLKRLKCQDEVHSLCHFSGILSFLLNNNELEGSNVYSGLKLEIELTNFTKNFVFSFNQSVLSLPSFPFWLTPRANDIQDAFQRTPGFTEAPFDNLQRFLQDGLGMPKESIQQLAGEQVNLGLLSPFRVIIEIGRKPTKKNKVTDLIGAELLRKKEAKELINFAVTLPEGFCGGEISRQMDDLLLARMTAAEMGKRASLINLRRDSCQESSCGALRVMAAVGKPNASKCLSIKFELDFFPAPQLDPKPKVLDFLSVVRGLPLDDNTQSYSSVPDLDPFNLEKSYGEQRVMPVDAVMTSYDPTWPHPSTAKVEDFISSRYPSGLIAQYESGIKSGNHDSLRITGVHSEAFRSKCLLTYEKVGSFKVFEESRNFASSASDNLELYRNDYLTAKRAEFLQSGYLPEFIELEKGPIISPESQGFEDIGYFFTRTVPNYSDDSIQLLISGKTSRNQTGPGRFFYSQNSQYSYQGSRKVPVGDGTTESFYFAQYEGTGISSEQASGHALAQMQAAAVSTVPNKQLEANHYSTSCSSSAISQASPTFYTFDAGASHTLEQSFGPGPKFRVELAATSENPNPTVNWNELSSTDVIFSSETLANVFLNGPPPLNENTGWVSHVDQAFSRFLTDNRITVRRTINDFDRTIEIPLQVVRKTLLIDGFGVPGYDSPSAQSLIFWALESTAPNKKAKVTYTLKLPATGCVVTLIANEVLTIRKYLVQKNSPLFMGIATVRVVLPQYKACYSNLGKAFKEGVDGKTEANGGEYTYTYPEGFLEANFDAHKSFPEVSKGTERSILVPASRVPLNALLEADPLSVHNTTFIGGLPLINLRHSVPTVKRVRYKLGTKNKEQVTRIGSLSIEKVNDSEIPKEFKNVEMMKSFITEIIKSYFVDHEVKTSEIKADDRRDSKGEKDHAAIEFSWETDLRLCDCNSPSSPDFSKNLYFGESYYARLTRTVVKIGTLSGGEAGDETNCVIKTLSKDGRFIFEPGQGVETLRVVTVRLVTWETCASSLQEGFIRLVIQ